MNTFNFKGLVEDYAKAIDSMVFEKVRRIIGGFVEESNFTFLVRIDEVYFYFFLRYRFSLMEEEYLFIVASFVDPKSLVDFSLDSIFSLKETKYLFCISPLLSTTENMVTHLEEMGNMNFDRKMSDLGLVERKIVLFKNLEAMVSLVRIGLEGLVVSYRSTGILVVDRMEKMYQCNIFFYVLMGLKPTSIEGFSFRLKSMMVISNIVPLFDDFFISYL